MTRSFGRGDGASGEREPVEPGQGALAGGAEDATQRAFGGHSGGSTSHADADGRESAQVPTLVRPAGSARKKRVGPRLPELMLSWKVNLVDCRGPAHRLH